MAVARSVAAESGTGGGNRELWDEQKSGQVEGQGSVDGTVSVPAKLDFCFRKGHNLGGDKQEKERESEREKA